MQAAGGLQENLSSMESLPAQELGPPVAASQPGGLTLNSIASTGPLTDSASHAAYMASMGSTARNANAGMGPNMGPNGGIVGASQAAFMGSAPGLMGANVSLPSSGGLSGTSYGMATTLPPSDMMASFSVAYTAAGLSTGFNGAPASLPMSAGMLSMALGHMPSGPLPADPAAMPFPFALPRPSAPSAAAAHPAAPQQASAPSEMQPPPAAELAAGAVLPPGYPLPSQLQLPAQQEPAQHAQQAPSDMPIAKKRRLLHAGQDQPVTSDFSLPSMDNPAHQPAPRQ